MNAYLLELLTYLFRLCFNQCNASLHFGSSKHSAYFQNPPSHSLLLTLWSLISHLVLLIPKSFVSSRCCFPKFLCHDHKSHIARVVYYSLVASARMHPISCIYPRFACCAHSYASKHPAVDLDSRVFTHSELSPFDHLL